MAAIVVDDTSISSESERANPKTAGKIRRDGGSSFSSYLQATPLAVILGLFLLLPILMIARGQLLGL